MRIITIWWSLHLLWDKSNTQLSLRTGHQWKPCVWEKAMAVELKRQHQNINKALCLGECYMAVELKRQHQNINESLVFGRMLCVELKRQHQNTNECLVLGRMLWLLKLKDNMVNAPNEQLFVRSGLWWPVIGKIFCPLYMYLLSLLSLVTNQNIIHLESLPTFWPNGITNINTKYMDQWKTYG